MRRSLIRAVAQIVATAPSSPARSALTDPAPAKSECTCREAASRPRLGRPIVLIERSYGIFGSDGRFECRHERQQLPLLIPINRRDFRDRLSVAQHPNFGSLRLHTI